jgi:hypothetical protein
MLAMLSCNAMHSFAPCQLRHRNTGEAPEPETMPPMLRWKPCDAGSVELVQDIYAEGDVATMRGSDTKD